MWLTRLALRNPVFILMMSLMTVVLGFVSLRRLSVDLFPEINVPVIRVSTFYAGAGPTDIEKAITEPLERAVSASPGVDRVESLSRQGFSSVAVWFNYGVNLDNAQFEVSQRVAQILNTLPPGIQQPFIIKFDITNIPVLQIGISSEGMDERQLYDLAYNVIEPQIERINGVASANVGGGRVREIDVAVHRDALRARGLGILDVVGAVQQSNLLLPSGNLRAGNRDYNVFSNTQVAKPKSLGDIIVRRGAAVTGSARDGAAAVRVSDVARVEDGAADQSEIVRVNGQRGVFLRVLKQPGANTIAVVDAVRAAVPKLRGVPPNVQLAIAFDQSHYIRSAVSALEHEAVWGGVLAIAVILIFLVSLRATGIIAIAIPLSILATFILLYFTGQTLNVFTLGGLALGVGRLVDDSIVELENIHRHLGMGARGAKAASPPERIAGGSEPAQGSEEIEFRKEAVLAAAQEVAMPILVSTITTIVVFFPVLFLTGVARNLFLPLALTIAFALSMSFFVSRTVTPLLCLYMLKGRLGEGEKGVAGWVGRMLARLDHGYGRSLGWVLRHRLLTVAMIAAVFGGSLFLKRFIGTEFFPESDESQFSAIFKAPMGTRVEGAERVAEKIEAAVNATLKTPGGKPIATTLISDVGLPLGRTAAFSQNTGPHSGNVVVNLVPRTERSRSDVQAVESVRSALRDALPGGQLYFFIGGIVKRILNFGAPAPIDVEIIGQDLDAGSDYAKKVAARMRPLADKGGKPWLTDVQITREENYPELDVEVDREKAGMLGISEQQIAQTVLTSLVGNTQFAPIPFTDEKTGNEYFINVRLDDPYRSHVDDLSDLVLRAPTGAMVPLDTIARVARGSGPVVINRKYLQRVVEVTANVGPGKDLGGASDAVSRVLAELAPPEGITVNLGGQTEAQKKAFADLGFAAVLAIVLVYMVLASQFKSLVDPLVIMFSVPLGVTGVFLALYITGTTLSVNSFMGIIMMVGIVVSNGVLLVDFANVLRERGTPLVEATIQAGKTRLRPILMTTIATIVGLLPMALGIGEGSETNLPLARAVIGGLAISTVFTLFLIPALYITFERLSRRRAESAAPRTAGAAGAAMLLIALALAGSAHAETPAGEAAAGPAPERITLAEAMRRALARNPSVVVATAEIERAEGLVKQARAGYTPTLTGNATATLLDHDRLLPSGQKVAARTQLGANVQLTVPIVSAPAWANGRQAEGGRRIAEASAVDVRRQIAQATARAYLTVLAQHRLIAAVETARASAKAHFDYAHTRLQGGIGRAIDEVRAAQELATTDRQRQTSYVALAQAREALGVLLAAPAPVDSVEEVELGAVPSMAEALDGARAQRADVKLLTARAASAQRRNDDTWVFYMPYLAAIGQPFLQEPPTILQPGIGWQAQLVLSLPLYDGGMRGGMARERAAILDQAKTNLDAALRQAVSEVRLGFESMWRADKALASAREAAEFAHKASELALIAYRAGATTNIEVLDAARQARDTDIAVAQAEDVAREARLDLLVASGRFP